MKFLYQKKLLAIIILTCAFNPIKAQDNSVNRNIMNDSTLVVLFWNLENFFDYKSTNDSKSTNDNKSTNSDNSNSSAKEFSPKGKRRWSAKRFYAKCDAISKSIYWITDTYGKLPDIIGFAEIENRDVLSKLLYSTLLRKENYKIIHFDSPDKRGIDVGLIYNSSALNYISSKPCHIYDKKGSVMSTRDILLAQFEYYNQIYSFLVCHFPSKYGGWTSSSSRKAAVSRFCSIRDSLIEKGKKNIIGMGDFNEGAENALFEPINNKMINLGLKYSSNNEGSIRFRGKWEIIDIFFVSYSIENKVNMDIVRIPFLMKYDKTYPGYKPYRTYSGPKYIGGISDHCPIMLKIRCND